MLTREAIREKDLESKWQQQIQVFHEIIGEVEYKDKFQSYSVDQAILVNLQKIDEIDNELSNENTNRESNDYKKLIFKRNILRIETSFFFLTHLINKKNISNEQKIKDFSIGINNIASSLVYSGESLHNASERKIQSFIQNFYTCLKVWESFSNRIEEESILLLHDNSAKLIYTSLYILEDILRYLHNNQDSQNILEPKNSWLKEDQLYDSLLADMEEWSKEEWSEEEQQAFARAMSNLS